jgi:hypothetical protein
VIAVGWLLWVGGGLLRSFAFALLYFSRWLVPNVGFVILRIEHISLKFDVDFGRPLPAYSVQWCAGMDGYGYHRATAEATDGGRDGREKEAAQQMLYHLGMWYREGFRWLQGLVL